MFVRVTGPGGGPVPACVVRPSPTGPMPRGVPTGVQVVPALTDASGRGSVLFSIGSSAQNGSTQVTLECGGATAQLTLQVSAL